jgi:hypothetical protein
MHRPVFSDIPLTAARWFLLINVVVAAWLYGVMREWIRTTISIVLIGNYVSFFGWIGCAEPLATAARHSRA